MAGPFRTTGPLRGTQGPYRAESGRGVSRQGENECER
jgi:hypothetical protein